MIRAALIPLISHWRRKPWQLLTLILGLSMATAIWAGVQAINAEARASYDRVADLAQMTALPEVVRKDGRPPTIADFAMLRRAGWPVTPILEGQLPVGRTVITIYGLDPFTHPLVLDASGETQTGAGVWFASQTGLFADPVTAKRLNELDILPEIQPLADLNPGRLFADISVAARLLDRKGEMSSLALAGGTSGDLPKPFILQDAPRASDIRGLTDSFHLNLTAFGFLAFIVGLFIFHSGIGLAVEQRRATIRTMRVIGIPMRVLVVLLTCELLCLALISGLIGLVLGYFVAASLMPDVSATLRGLYGGVGVEGLVLRRSWIVSGLLLAAAGTLLAGSGALLQVAKMPLLRPAMPRAWARSSQTKWNFAALSGVILGLASVVVYGVWGQLIGAFALLGGALICASLSLPVLLRWFVERCASWARGPIPRWFWADTNAQLPALSLSLMALMLALSANVGVNTMVSSFRSAFSEFLDQRLVSDIYVTASSEQEAEALQTLVGSGAVAILPIWHVDATLFDRPAEIYGVADHQIYRNNWPLLASSEEVWARLYSGKGALISEQLSRRSGLGIGDKIELDQTWAQTIVGTYSDYGNPGGQVIVSMPELLKQHPNVPKHYFGILTEPNQTSEVLAALTNDLGFAQSVITERETVRAFSLRIFEQTFLVTSALNTLTLGVACFAMLTSLMSLAAMRVPQLAPVWAIGMTTRKLATIEVLRASILAGLTFAFALPVGLVLAWILLKILNAEAFGWQLPMQVFPVAWLELAVLSLAAGALSATWPALRLARLTPAKLTQVFANER